MKPPEPLLSALHEVTQGKPFPWVWLATWDALRGPQVRTVRLLAFNWLQGVLTFGCHAEHGTLKQIGGEPRGQLCLLREQPVLQIRLDVTLSAGPGSQHPQGERLWQKLSAADKVQLYQGHPQRPSLPAHFWLVEAHLRGAAEVVRMGEGVSRVQFSLRD